MIAAHPVLRAGRLACCLALTAARPAPAGAQGDGRYAFVVMVGQDTFAVENVTRHAARLQGQITGAALPRLEYDAALGDGAETREITLRVWAPGATAGDEPVEDAHLELRGDSLVARIRREGRTAVQRIAFDGASVLYPNPSFALMEQIVLRAAELNERPARIPVFVTQGGHRLHAAVRWPAPDSVVVTLGGSELHARVGAGGRLLRGAIPAQQLSVHRVEGVHPAAGKARAVDYSAPAGAPYTAEDARIETSRGHRLAGTLTRPRRPGPLPAVVLVSGSGAQQRDSEIPHLSGYRPFRELADALARRGIAVLRYDDRGVGGSGGDHASATSADLAEDARAALGYLRLRADVDANRLAIVGHSEGGLIALLVAARDPALGALVLMGTAARPGAEVLREQQRAAILRSALPPERRDSAMAASRAQTMELAARSPWLRFFLEHDPLATAREVCGIPVLILHGETDRQVDAVQAGELRQALRAAGNRRVHLQIFPAVNHLLLADPNGEPAGYAALEDRGVAPAVLNALAGWLAERLR
jgi:alpha-beta hydrolase superfamily lysophospholipase